MSDVLLYWRDYRKNEGTGLAAWHSNAALLNDLHQGDHLWFVTSGKNLRLEPAQAGFLVAVWQVLEVKCNPGDDSAYPPDDYRFRVVGNESESLILDEPVLVDSILRPEGRDKAVSIGRFLQGPRKLKDQAVREIRAAAGPKLALKWLTGNKA
jgi:hypothetical protein